MVKRAEPHRHGKPSSAAARAWLASAAIVGATLCAPPSEAQAGNLLTAALNRCLMSATSEASGDGLSWVQPEAKASAVALLYCRGEEARALYDALGGVVAEQGPRQQGNRRFLVREFGASAVGVTRCEHAIPDPDGNSPAAFACWIGVDASPALLGAMLP